MPAIVSLKNRLTPVLSALVLKLKAVELESARVPRQPSKVCLLSFTYPVLQSPSNNLPSCFQVTHYTILMLSFKV